MSEEGKVCTGCGIWQPLSNFRVDKSRKDGHQFRCKNCQIAASAQPHRVASRHSYWVRTYTRKPPQTPLTPEENQKRIVERRNLPENKAKVKKWSQEFYSDPENRKRRITAQSVYNSLPSTKQRRSERDKERKAEDPQYALSCLLRSRLKRAVNGKSKSGSSVADLGCSVAELQEHLQSRFQPGMTWENRGKGRGKWHVDHIIPLAAFDLTQRQHMILACHYLNLQPLWEKDNLDKRFSDFAYIGFSKNQSKLSKELRLRLLRSTR